MISFLLTWRALVLLAVGAMTAVLGWSALTLRIDPGVESMIPSGPGDLARLQASQSRFGSDEIVVLAFHSDRLFSIFPLRTRLHEVPPWPLEASSFMARRCIAR